MAGGCFSRALQAEHKDYALRVGALKLKVLLGVAKHRDDSVVNYFYKLLAGVNGSENFLALGFFYRSVYKAADDAKVYVSLKQGHLDLLYRVLNVFFCNRRFSADRSKNVGKGVGQFFKHEFPLKKYGRQKNGGAVYLFPIKSSSIKSSGSMSRLRMR